MKNILELIKKIQNDEIDKFDGVFYYCFICIYWLFYIRYYLGSICLDQIGSDLDLVLIVVYWFGRWLCFLFQEWIGQIFSWLEKILQNSFYINVIYYNN